MKHISISNSSESDDPLADESQNVEDILAAARALQNPRLPLIADIVNPNLEANIKKNYRRSVVQRAVKPVIYTSTPYPTARSGSDACNISSLTTIQDDEVVEDKLEKPKVVNRFEEHDKSTKPHCIKSPRDVINEEVKVSTSSNRAENLSKRSLVKDNSKSKVQLEELEHSLCRINQQSHSREVERSRRINNILTKEDNTQSQGQNHCGIKENLNNISRRSKFPQNDNRSKHSDAEYSEKHSKYTTRSNRRRKTIYDHSDEHYTKNRKRRNSRARSRSISSDEVNEYHIINKERRKLRNNDKNFKRPRESRRPSRAKRRRKTEYDSYTESESSDEKRNFRNGKRTVKDTDYYDRPSSSFSSSSQRERRYSRRRVKDTSPEYRKRLRNRKVRVPEEVKYYIKKSLRNYRSESRGNKYRRRIKHSKSPRKYSSYSSELDEADYDERRSSRATGYYKQKDIGTYNVHRKSSPAKSKNRKDLLLRESPEVDRTVANKRCQHDSIEHPINHNDLDNNRLSSGLSCLSNFSPSYVISGSQEIGRIRTLRHQISKLIARRPTAHLPENVRLIFQDFDYSESDLNTTLQPNNDNKYLRRSGSSSKRTCDYDKTVRLHRTVKSLWSRQHGETGNKTVSRRILLKVKDAETQSSFKNLRSRTIRNRPNEETASEGDKNRSRVLQNEVENKILKIKDAATQSSLDDRRPKRFSTKLLEESSSNKLGVLGTESREINSDHYPKIVQSNVDVNKKVKDAETQSSFDPQVSSRISNLKSTSHKPIEVLTELEGDFDHCSPIHESKIVQSHEDNFCSSSSEQNIREELASSRLSRKKTPDENMSKQKVKRNTISRNLPGAASLVDELSMSGCQEISEHVELRRPVMRNLLRSFMNATSNSTSEVQRSKANRSNEENYESEEEFELNLSRPEMIEPNKPVENCGGPIQKNSESVELPPTQECDSIGQQISEKLEEKLRKSVRTPKVKLVLLQNLTVKKVVGISSKRDSNTVEPPKESVIMHVETSPRKLRDRRKSKVKETSQDQEDQPTQLEPPNLQTERSSRKWERITKRSKQITNVNETTQPSEGIELLQLEPPNDGSILHAESISRNFEGKTENSTPKTENSTPKTNLNEDQEVEEILSTQLESPDENLNIVSETSSGKLEGKTRSSKRKTKVNKTPEPSEDMELLQLEPPKDSSIIHSKTISKNLAGKTKNSTPKTNLNEDPQVEEILSTQLESPDENLNRVSETSFGKLECKTRSSKRKTKVNKTPQPSEDMELLQLEPPKNSSIIHSETISRNLAGKTKNSPPKTKLNEDPQVEEILSAQIESPDENLNVVSETSSGKLEGTTRISKRKTKVNKTLQASQDIELIQIDCTEENPTVHTETSSRNLVRNNSSRKTSSSENPQLGVLQSTQLEPPDENCNTIPETSLGKSEGKTTHSIRKTNVNETPQATKDVEIPQLESPSESPIYAETSSHENPHVEDIQSTQLEPLEENCKIVPETSCKKLPNNKKKNKGTRKKNETPQVQKILPTDTNSKIVDGTSVKSGSVKKTKKQTNSKKNKKLESDNLCAEDTSEGLRRSRRDRKPPKACYWKEEITEIDCYMYAPLVESRKWNDEQDKPVSKKLHRKKKSEKQESASQEAALKKPSENASETASEPRRKRKKAILGANSTEQNQIQKVVSQKPSISDTDFFNSNSANRMNSTDINDFGYATRDTSEEIDPLLSVDGAQNEISFHENICKEIDKQRDNILTCPRDQIPSLRHIDLGKMFKSKEKFGYVVIHPKEFKTSRCDKYTMVYTVFHGECSAKIGHKRYDCQKGMFSVPKGVNYVIENKGAKPVILHYVMCENRSTALSGG